MKYLVKAKGKEVYFEGQDGPVVFDTKASAQDLAEICTLGSSKGYEYEVVETE